MEYSPQYRKGAEKYLDRLPAVVSDRIMSAVDALPEGDIVKLQGRVGYRLVVGSFRVLFDFTDEITDDGKIVIDVIDVGPRGGIYKK